MMWTFFYFFLILILNLKEKFFFSSAFIVSTMEMIMISIIPVIMTMIIHINFSYINFNENMDYKSSFIIILILTSINFMSGNMFLFVFTLELTVFPMVYLVLKFSKDKDKIPSMIYMFGINIFGSLPLLICVAKNMNMMNNQNLIYFEFSNSTDYLNLFWFCLMLASKVPIFLMSFWLTKAHVSASGSCSMILASIMLKLGGFGLYKYMPKFLNLNISSINLFLSFGVTSFMMILFVMIRMFDIKNMIACSSILHMSFVYPFMYAHSNASIISSILMLAAHGLVSGHLFFIITLMYEKSNSRNLESQKSLESLDKNFLMILFIYVFLNMGFPPFTSFYSEILMVFVVQNLSFFLTVIMLILLLLEVIVAMFFLTKEMFGKKMSYNQKFLNNNLNIKSMMNFIPFVLLVYFN